MKMIKTDYQDIHEHVGKLYKSIKESNVSDIIIIAVARGGWLVSRILAAYCEKDGMSCDSYSIAASYAKHRTPHEHVVLRQKLDDDSILRINQGLQKGAKIVIVDSVCQTGRELSAIRDYISDVFHSTQVLTAAIHVVKFKSCPSAPWRTVFLQPDYHGVLFEYDEMPYIDYPWEYTSLKDFQKEDKTC